MSSKKSRGASKPALKKLRDRHIAKQHNRCCWCEKPMLPPGTSIEGKPNEMHPRSATLEHLGAPNDHKNTAAACFECNSNHVGKNRVPVQSADRPEPARTEGVPDTLRDALAQCGVSYTPKHKKRPKHQRVAKKHSFNFRAETLALEDEEGRRELEAARRGIDVERPQKRLKAIGYERPKYRPDLEARERAVKRGAEMFEASKPKGPSR